MWNNQYKCFDWKFEPKFKPKTLVLKVFQFRMFLTSEEKSFCSWFDICQTNTAVFFESSELVET